MLNDVHTLALGWCELDGVAGRPEAIQWGVMVFTRVFKHDVHTGFQVVCRHPLHIAKVCQKTRNLRAAGGSENCLRELKTWMVWGIACKTPAEHAGMWKDVLKAAALGTLLEKQFFDDFPIDDWDTALTAYGVVDDVEPPAKRVKDVKHNSCPCRFILLVLRRLASSTWHKARIKTKSEIASLKGCFPTFEYVCS